MNKWFELILGLIIVVLVILFGWASSAYSWTLFGKDLNLLHAAWIFLKGAVFIGVLIVGIVLILLGIMDVKG